MKKYIPLFSFVILIVATSATIAQPGLPTVPSQVPIDAGLGLLAVAGGAYAIKKLKSTEK